MSKKELQGSSTLPALIEGLLVGAGRYAHDATRRAAERERLASQTGKAMGS